MSYVQAIVLGLVQGLGEFLPISSSAHLVLVPWFMGWTHFSLTYDVALHMGTLLAVTIYFWRDLISLATEGLTKGTSTPTGRLAWGIAAGTVPGALFGYFLEERVDTVRNPISIAILLALMGIVLYVVDRRGAKNRSVDRITLWDVVIIGVGQAFAIIPGVSRSGATISVALMRGLERGAAAKVSFLLGWPIILGAGLLALRKLTLADLTPAFWTGIAVSGLSGYLVIAFLMDYLRRGTFLVFAIYRVAVAALTVFIAMLRG